MKKLIIAIMMILALAVSVSAYKTENGRITLDNSDVASILNDYGGSQQAYIAAHVTQTRGNGLGIMAPAGCTNCKCSATNPKEDIEVKGFVNAEYLYNNFSDVTVNYTDVCEKDLGFKDEGVLKVNCDGSAICNFPKWTRYDCPNKDCHDGTCTKANVPEFGMIAVILAVIGAVAIIAFRKR
jgi:hypothetical protein